MDHPTDRIVILYFQKHGSGTSVSTYINRKLTAKNSPMFRCLYSELQPGAVLDAFLLTGLCDGMMLFDDADHDCLMLCRDRVAIKFLPGDWAFSGKVCGTKLSDN